MSAKADYVTLAVGVNNRTNSLVFAAGESADVVWCGGNFAYTYWTLEVAGTTIGRTSGVGSVPDYFHIVGPAKLTFWSWYNGVDSPPASIMTINKFSANPNTVNVVPRGQGAVVSLQTTFDLSGQWTTLFSQVFTNSTPTNQFFKFTMSAP